MLAAREFLKLKDIYVSSEILRINRHLTSHEETEGEDDEVNHGNHTLDDGALKARNMDEHIHVTTLIDH